MELKEGMYVRTEYGIAKIIEIIDDNLYCDNTIMRSYGENYYSWDIPRLNILKVSNNIIDLIEVGDYINGELVLEKVLYGNNAGVKVFGDIYYIEDIKSIVTKEQFEAMKYEIK